MTKTVARTEIEELLERRLAEFDRALASLVDQSRDATELVRQTVDVGGPTSENARARYDQVCLQTAELQKQRARVRGALVLERLRPLFDAVLALGEAAEREIADADHKALHSLQWGGADLLLELARMASTGARTQWPAAQRIIDKAAQQ